MSLGNQPDHRPRIPCCIHLRSKGMYYLPDERPGLLHDSDATNPWCLLTQSPAGPDGEAAIPGTCQPGRACFCTEETTR